MGKETDPDPKTEHTPFLTAGWRNLVVLNYEVEPELLHPYVPSHTELDDYQDRYYISVVGFLFENVKWKGILPIYPVQTFEEVNVRFYVRRKVGSEVRRGVCFLREFVPYFPISWTANTLYNESYRTVPMDHEWDCSPNSLEGGTFAYSWSNDGTTNEIFVTTEGPMHSLEEESFEAFILEHYWGYTSYSKERTLEYRVEHPSWQYWNTDEVTVEFTPGKQEGGPVFDVISDDPHSAFVANGSEVSVYPGTFISG